MISEKGKLIACLLLGVIFVTLAIIIPGIENEKLENQSETET